MPSPLNKSAEIIRLLLKYPMTAEMVYYASENFVRPFIFLTQAKAVLKELYDKGYLNRQTLAGFGPGRMPYLYFLRKKAKEIAPEIAETNRSNSAFRGLCEAPIHALFTSEVMSRLEWSVGKLKERVRILGSIRPRYFKAKVEVITSEGRETVSLIPDYTQIIMIDGVPNLFFFEIQHHAAVINPASPQSLLRSFRFKLAKYKAFKRHFRGHHIVRQFEKLLRFRFPGFRVLVVTTKGVINKMNLLEASRAHKSMVYIATLEDIKRVNFFSEPIWSLPCGVRRSIME